MGQGGSWSAQDGGESKGGGKHSKEENYQKELHRNPITDSTILIGHTDCVRIMTRINATLIATGSDDQTVIIWDCSNGKMLHVLHGHDLPITCMLSVPFSPSTVNVSTPDVTYYLVTGSNDKTLRVWDVTTGKLLHVLMGHTSTITCLEYITGCYFCSGGNDDRQMIIWNIITGEKKKIIHRVEDKTLNSILSMEKQRLIVTASDTLVAYKDLEFKVHLSILHRESVKSLSAVNEEQFVSGSLDGTIVLWSANTLQKIRILFHYEKYGIDAHSTNYIYKVHKIIPLSRHYLAVALGTGFKIFHVKTGECIINIEKAHQSELTSIVALYNNEMIVTASSDHTIRLWGEVIPPVFRIPLRNRSRPQQKNQSTDGKQKEEGGGEENGSEDREYTSSNPPSDSEYQTSYESYYDTDYNSDYQTDDDDFSFHHHHSNSNSNINDNDNEYEYDEDNNNNHNPHLLRHLPPRTSNFGRGDDDVSNDPFRRSTHYSHDNYKHLHTPPSSSSSQSPSPSSPNHAARHSSSDNYYFPRYDNHNSPSSQFVNNNNNPQLQHQQRQLTERNIKSQSVNSIRSTTNNNSKNYIKQRKMSIDESHRGVISQKNNNHNSPNIKSFSTNQLAPKKQRGRAKSFSGSRHRVRHRLLTQERKVIVCYGEMCLHTGAVLDLIKISDFGFASAGFDGFLILWKDGRIQSEIRNNISSKFVIEERRKLGISENSEETSEIDFDSSEEITIFKDYNPSILSSFETQTLDVKPRRRSTSHTWNTNLSGPIIAPNS